MHQTEKEAIRLPVKLWSVCRRLWLKNHSPTDALTIKQLASWPYLSGSHDFWVSDMSLHANADGYRYLATPLFIWQLVLDKNKEMWPCYFVRLVTKTHVGGHQCRGWQQICLSPQVNSNSGVKWAQFTLINTLRPRQECRHFSDDIFKGISWMKACKLRITFHWSVFPRVQSTIFHHWLR